MRSVLFDVISARDRLDLERNVLKIFAKLKSKSNFEKVCTKEIRLSSQRINVSLKVLPVCENVCVFWMNLSQRTLSDEQRKI
jgi:hypothetical protein